MLAGGHRCLGSNVSSSSLETAAAATAANLPGEPLLFLYPRWFCAISTTPTVKRVPKGARTYRQWSTLGPLVRQQRRSTFKPSQWFGARCYSSSCVALPRPHFANPILNSGPTVREGNDLTASGDVGAPILDLSSTAVEAGAQCHPGVDSTTPSLQKSTNWNDSNATFEGQQFNHLSRYLFTDVNGRFPAIVRPHLRTDAEVKARKREDQKRWQVVFNNLMELSQESSQALDADEEAIEIPETTIAELLGDIGENKFYMTNMSGCMIHVLPRGIDFDGNHRRIVLTGSPVARRMTIEVLQDLAAETKLKGESDNLQALKIRFAWSSSGQSRVGAKRADTVPTPVTWTLKSFSQFIEHLVSVPMAYSNHRILYKPEERHTRIVCNILCRMFDDPVITPLMSTYPINILISYLNKHGSLPQLWALYNKIEPFMTTRSFNTLLENVALKGDLRLFNNIVNKMRVASVKPNAITWACLLRASRTRTARASIFCAMRDQGMLDNDHYLQSAMPPILSRDYYRMVQTGTTAADFVKYMDSKIGSRWFSKLAAREMVYVSVMFRDKAGIGTILEHCDKLGIKPDNWTSNQILRLFATVKDFVGGIRFFLYAHEHYNFQADHEVLDMLFLLAWNCEAPNTCRVIWWYACLKEGASWTMRSKIKDSLQQNAKAVSNISDSKTPANDTWENIAGKLIVGIDPSALLKIQQDKLFTAWRDAMEANKPDGYSKTNPLKIIDYLNTYTPQGELRRQQCQLVEHIVRSDMNAALRWETTAPFVDMLIDAANIDANKDESDIWGADISVEKVMGIPLKRKRDSVIYKYYSKVSG
ncbi:hypothetical protein AAP_05916 [Ascosphaera apis ARSEF 7405]|uniref:Pentatricopeptide repeat protein n=1 Tax=Ascosphaera apis ARSEF 7405 TaxID=392613 RepID=A0A167V7J2_9EURO|nr:hypothetical protein AAP_05916 [Ascosphaera apis ARSEF 7405]